MEVSIEEYRGNVDVEYEKLARWLSLAKDVPQEESEELAQLINRLKRKALYTQTEPKAEKAVRLEEIKLKKKNGEKLSPDEKFTLEVSEGTFKKNPSYVEYIQKRQKENKRKLKQYLEDLKSGKFKQALDWLDEKNFIDDEIIGYAIKSEDVRKNVSDFLNVFVEYVHCGFTDVTDREFYNDEVDDWYYKYHNDPDSEESYKYLANDYIFPEEEWVFKFKDRYFRYNETSGQGTVYRLWLMDEKELSDFAEEYNVTVQTVLDKAINLEKETFDD